MGRTKASESPAELAARFSQTRAATVALTSHLTEEDCCVQSQPCCSPVKWHLGHTTWFFERFIVRNTLGRDPYDERFEYLFNSYYNALGQRQPRTCRGLLTRPGLGEVLAFREAVDEQVAAALRDDRVPEEAMLTLELGLNHEQQHQELLLTDVKHLFSCSPLGIAYADAPAPRAGESGSASWVPFDAGVYEIGEVFGVDPKIYDNEGPVHRVHAEAFELADRLVTNAEYQAFVDDGGYDRPELWLDLGWRVLQENEWRAPAYWFDRDDQRMEFTLHGPKPLDPSEPVCHISFFEADAYARWAGARLPTEFELEIAWCDDPDCGTMLDEHRFHPAAAGPSTGGLRQIVGDLWEWTSSSYSPYPGYRPPAGAIGEYNGKFMCNQYVLRGGSCATPRDHIRRTYRNFFEPEARWQFSGVRLARSIGV